MMKLRLLACAMAVMGCMGVLAQPVMADGNSASGSSEGSIDCPEGMPREKANSYAECSIPPEESDRYDLMDRVTIVINVVVGVVGIVSVAMIVLGGISYATSQGDAAKAKKAQNTILYSVVGLLISLLAFAIVNFVLTSVF